MGFELLVFCGPREQRGALRRHFQAARGAGDPAQHAAGRNGHLVDPAGTATGALAASLLSPRSNPGTFGRPQRHLLRNSLL